MTRFSLWHAPVQWFGLTWPELGLCLWIGLLFVMWRLRA